LINAQGRSTFVKFHWKPMLGTHSVVWDEARKIAGADPDFNRRDLWERIRAGPHDLKSQVTNSLAASPG
jgi:catalase